MSDIAKDFEMNLKMKSIVAEIANIDEKMDVLETRKSYLRKELEVLMTDLQSYSVEGIAVIKKIPESISYSYDTKSIQLVVDILLRDNHSKYAKMLADAKKETIRKSGIRILKWKDSE
jgi:hypothetical protein